VSLPVSTLEQIGATGGVTAEVMAVYNANGLPASPEVILDPDGNNAIVEGRAPRPPDIDGRPAAYRTQYYPGGDRLHMATPIVVGPGEHHGGVFFQLVPHPTTTVSGIVAGPQGPAANQVLRLRHLDDEDTIAGSEIAMTISALDGSFTFTTVPTGRYVLEAQGRAPRHTAVPELVPRPEEHPYMWGRTAVAVEDSPVEGIDVVVQEAPAIAGRLIFERQRAGGDAAPMAISLEPIGGVRQTITTRTDGDGTFAFDAVVPGDYVVRAAAPAGWHQKQVIVSSGEVTDGAVRVPPDTSAIGMTITLTDRPSRVTGFVRDPRGLLVSGAAVIAQPVSRGLSLVPDARRARIVRAAANGVYTLVGLPPGEYAIVAIEDALTDGWHETRRLEALRSAGTRVTVRDGETTGVDLRTVRR
jgi:hypothetical protein